MSRHDNVVCRGCSKVGFSGRCYRCLSCPNFDICADCYDLDFTTESHLFDHPVKCVYTPADVELYFEGEYISSDPPQSYRCPYCKLWGFNEATFLEHISGMHPTASPLLVSTMITLFEQQQASRMFLENEQLASMAAAANSRNEQMNHTEGTLVLRLVPLNPDGSYPRALSSKTQTFIGAAARDGPLLLRRPAPASEESPDVTTRGGVSVRRRSGPSASAGLRFNMRTVDHVNLAQPSYALRSPANGSHPVPAPPTSPSTGQHRMTSDMTRYNGTTPLPTSRSSRARNPSSSHSPMFQSGIAIAGHRPTTDQSHGARFFGRPSARDFFLADPPMMDQFRGSGFGVSHETTAWPAFSAASPMFGNHGPLVPAPRDLGANTLPPEDRDVLTQSLNEALIHSLIASMEKPPPQEKRDTRYLCSRFFSHATLESPAQNAFLAHRAEFVSQLLASTLHEEEPPEELSTDEADAQEPATHAPQMKAHPSSDLAAAVADADISPR
ncbi:uncharacterized protein LOC111074728 [Drosophila obscura]|uniref:uncharacterized protein LOC111074728 n=1 Tax=Drosophila obscura TaxID=7282 RepID=UPI001BB1A22F|nr:uncharacterized protein LOC111074728 [Drosophila obscura]